MNENEIERIANAANALRPDWPVSSLRTLLAKPELARRTRRDVAVALAWVACESATKTPARVLEAGPWWQATNAEDGRGEWRTDWLDKCRTCSLPETTCRKLYDEHEFVSNRDVRDGKVPPILPAPMPESLRAKLRGTGRRRADGADCARPAPTTTEESVSASEAAGDVDQSSGEVGTGAGEGAPRQDTGSAWVTRSADCPEAPAQAHLPAPTTTEAARPESETSDE